jgi:hypothetical protein
MMHATGCISIGTRNGSAFPIDRVIEYVSIDPSQKGCTIWYDVFINNTTEQDQCVSVLHRGNLTCENVTREAWSRPSVVRQKNSWVDSGSGNLPSE